MKLTETQINNELQKIDDVWTIADNSLYREYTFENFIQAFSYMSAIALYAEKIDHHPDWRNVYNSVTLSLSTHDEGGITEKDFALAVYADDVYNKSHT